MVMFENELKFFEVVALSATNGFSVSLSCTEMVQLYHADILSPNYRYGVNCDGLKFCNFDNHIRIRNGPFSWPSCRYPGA